MSELENGVQMTPEQKAKYEAFLAKDAREAKLNKMLTEGENAAIYKKIYDDPASGLKNQLEKNPEIIDVDKWMTSVFSQSVDTFLANKEKGTEAPKNTVNAPPPVAQQGGVAAPQGEQKPETVDLRTVGRKGGITVKEFCEKTGMTELQASEYLAVLG